MTRQAFRALFSRARDRDLLLLPPRSLLCERSVTGPLTHHSLTAVHALLRLVQLRRAAQPVPALSPRPRRTPTHAGLQLPCCELNIQGRSDLELTCRFHLACCLIPCHADPPIRLLRCRQMPRHQPLCRRGRNPGESHIISERDFFSPDFLPPKSQRPPCYVCAQAYTINQAKAVFLNVRPQTKSAATVDMDYCRTCMRNIRVGSAYCCLACKVIDDLIPPNPPARALPKELMKEAQQTF